MTAWLLFAALFLAFGNGANDNFKGFATVWGSRELTYRTALALATVATLAGSLLSLVLAEALVSRFTGIGLVADDVASAPEFMLAVALAAALTVIAATRAGFPVSTTHALIGGLIGAGLATSGTAINLDELGSKFLLPLLVSPIIAAGLGLAAYALLRQRNRADCLCLVEPTVSADPGGALTVRADTVSRILIGTKSECDNLVPSPARLSLSALKDGMHLMSAASICFARGVNDTPKLAALLLGTRALGSHESIGVIAAAMALGGVLFARRVAETMSLRLNRMNASQGLSANLITATLVLFASKFGLPVSTTHVSVGSIAGTGAGGGTTDWHTFRNILLSWLATLPAAAALAWMVVLALHP